MRIFSGENKVSDKIADMGYCDGYYRRYGYSICVYSLPKEEGDIYLENYRLGRDDYMREKFPPEDRE